MRRPEERLGRRTAIAATAVVALVAVLGALVVWTWYRTLEEGEQRADERGYEQIAVLLLRRIDREGRPRLPAIVSDFRSAVAAHVVVVDGGERLVSPGTPPAVERYVTALQEPDVLRVRRRSERIASVRYELFGGSAASGIRGYLVREASPPERATTLRPALVIGWAVTVGVAALVAFAVGRRKERGLRHARERERSLTSAIAHELRTPLTSVLTSASLLEAQSSRLPEEAVRPAAVLHAELERLRTLVEDLLELARLEAGDHAMHVEVVALGSVVEDVVGARSWSARVDTDLDGGAAAAVDRLSFSRIVLNLVDNALRHGGGDVCVRVRQVDDEVVLEVADGGTADVADLRRTLAGEVSRHGAGSRPGLGLRIAQQNASLHDAAITVDVDGDRGTTFRLTLPAVDPVTEDGHVAGRPRRRATGLHHP